MAPSLKANVRIIRGQPRGEPQDTRKKQAEHKLVDYSAHSIREFSSFLSFATNCVPRVREYHRSRRRDDETIVARSRGASFLFEILSKAFTSSILAILTRYCTRESTTKGSNRKTKRRLAKITARNRGAFETVGRKKRTKVLGF